MILLPLPLCWILTDCFLLDVFLVHNSAIFVVLVGELARVLNILIRLLQVMSEANPLRFTGFIDPLESTHLVWRIMVL